MKFVWLVLSGLLLYYLASFIIAPVIIKIIILTMLANGMATTLSQFKLNYEKIRNFLTKKE